MLLYLSVVNATAQVPPRSRKDYTPGVFMDRPMVGTTGIFKRFPVSTLTSTAFVEFGTSVDGLDEDPDSKYPDTRSSESV